MAPTNLARKTCGRAVFFPQGGADRGTGTAVNSNPYEPPGFSAPQGPPSKTPFILAAIGAFAASLYWAALALMVSRGESSGVQAIMPFVLAGLYGFRGFQVFSGDPGAAQRLLWLHGIGAAMTVFQMTQGGDGVVMLLQGIKVAIHLFGGGTAYFALKARR
jgi:hypothetical protein